ncbi:thiamine biosynthesis protein ThiF [Clostridiales bacterium PH28_bin88]|nr:thiamine biosynthesis protein ThiF [Clostridiales bacterium PH28_bin88]
MQHQFSRTELLIGPEGLRILEQSKVAVFGIGGVGSFTVEALARAGVGSLVLVDFDEICLTNINRQLHALYSTVGEPKVEVMKKRVLDINPRARVEAIQQFYSPENGASLLTRDVSYVVDAMDTVSAKVHLIASSSRAGIPVVSCMGAGNRLDPTTFRVADISETRACPLARVVRKELRKLGIVKGVKVVYSPEQPLVPDKSPVDCKNFCVCPGGDAHCTRKNQIPGSISFVPPVAGLFLASVVVNDLLHKPA